MPRPRLHPEKPFPAYAYLPGRAPHPVRHPLGHSYGIEPDAVASEMSLSSEAFRWGVDLFNHGYYWEAHEAWEPLWRATATDGPDRKLMKGLILFAAAGVKLREGKPAPARRHAARAAALFRAIPAAAEPAVERALGLPAAALADHADAVGLTPVAVRPAPGGQPEAMFGFVLVARAEPA